MTVMGRGGLGEGLGGRGGMGRSAPLHSPGDGEGAGWGAGPQGGGQGLQWGAQGRLQKGVCWLEQWGFDGVKRMGGGMGGAGRPALSQGRRGEPWARGAA